MNIIQRLEAWAMSRHISEQLPNKADYVANVVGELGEYYEAVKNKDENETVDAIADIIVFSITEVFKAFKNYPVISAVYEDDEYYAELVAMYQKFGYESNRSIFIFTVVKEIGAESSKYQYLFNTINTCYNKLVNDGYDIRLVMDEVLKVLESRTGTWSDEAGKFLKDESLEAKALWYEPDYSKCKLPVVLEVIEDVTEKNRD